MVFGKKKVKKIYIRISIKRHIFYVVRFIYIYIKYYMNINNGIDNGSYRVQLRDVAGIFYGSVSRPDVSGIMPSRRSASMDPIQVPISPKTIIT